MARQTKEEIIERLDAALAQGFIWNVDFQTLKRHTNRSYEGAYEAMLDEADKGIEAEYDLYYDLPMDLHNITSKKFAKLLKNSSGSYAEMVRAFVVEWTPIKNKLAALKPMIKKGRKPSESPQMTLERTLENTGTCAACGRNVKRRGDGSITDHGYQVPWGGYGRTQNCFGVGYDPIEVSDLGLKAAFDSATRGKLNLLQAIQTYEKGDCELTRGTPRKSITVKPGDAKYGHYLKMYLELLRRNLINTERSIENYIRAIEGWKIEPLPLEAPEETENRREAYAQGKVA